MDVLVQEPTTQVTCDSLTESDAVVPSLKKEVVDSPSSPLEMETEGRTNGTSESNGDSELITDKVKEEQLQLEEKARLEEEEEYKQRKELWIKMDEDTKELRYQKLQALLQKSTMFAEYIIRRMEQQKEEERERREKWLNTFADQKQDEQPNDKVLKPVKEETTNQNKGGKKRNPKPGNDR